MTEGHYRRTLDGFEAEGASGVSPRPTYRAPTVWALAVAVAFTLAGFLAGAETASAVCRRGAPALWIVGGSAAAVNLWTAGRSGFRVTYTAFLVMLIGIGGFGFWLACEYLGAVP